MLHLKKKLQAIVVEWRNTMSLTKKRSGCIVTRAGKYNMNVVVGLSSVDTITKHGMKDLPNTFIGRKLLLMECSLR